MTVSWSLGRLVMNKMPQKLGTFVLLGSLLLLLFPLFLVQAEEYAPPPGSGLDCGLGDPAGDENPASTDLVGDLSEGYWTGATWYDTDDTPEDPGFLYFAVRVNGDPSGPKESNQSGHKAGQTTRT